MAEYINKEELLKDIDDSVRFSTRNGVSAELRGAHKIVDCIRSAPAADVVSQAVFDQVKWERDTALATLKEHGIGLAEKADVVEVVHGYWEFNRGQAYGEPLYFCSVCTDGGSEWGKDKYCPNCGAKMDVKEQGE